jgi:hypothetical protein
MTKIVIFKKSKSGYAIDTSNLNWSWSSALKTRHKMCLRV